MLQASEETVEMASLFNFGFVHKRGAESQPRPSGPADNEEDRENVEILSPSQPATSTQPEQNLDLTRDSEESQDEEDNDI